MPLATLRSESLLMISGSRLRKSARSPKVTEPPDFGGPTALPCPAPPPPPHAAMASSAAVRRIPSDRLRMALLSPLGWPHRPPHPGRGGDSLHPVTSLRAPQVGCPVRLTAPRVPPH